MSSLLDCSMKSGQKSDLDQYRKLPNAKIKVSLLGEVIKTLKILIPMFSQDRKDQSIDVGGLILWRTA